MCGCGCARFADPFSPPSELPPVARPIASSAATTMAVTPAAPTPDSIPPFGGYLSRSAKSLRLSVGIGLDSDRCRLGLAATEDPRQIRLGDQHLARFRALVAGDDAAALEHVDQPAGAGVADPQ